MTAPNKMAKRAAAGTLALAVCLGGGILGAGAAQADASFAFDNRVAGADRIVTAVEASKDAYPTSAGTVIVVNDEATVDGLTASYAAGLNDAPILYVKRDSIPAETAAEITRLGATKVIIVGGTSVVSSGVQSSLGGGNKTVTRLSGSDRYATAAAVATSGTAKPGKVFIANGDAPADALAAGPIAFAKKYPVLLTEAADVPASTNTALNTLAVDTRIVLGGNTVVSTSTYSDLNGTTRLGGANRQETATLVAGFATGTEGFAGVNLGLVGPEDRNTADALIASPLLAKQQAPLLFTARGSISAETSAYLKANAAKLTGEGYVFGGEVAVPSAIATEGTVAAGGTGTVTGTIAVSPTDASVLVIADETDDTPTSDDRVYTVAGLDAALTYRVTLVAEENITVENGVVSFEEDGATGLAAAGLLAADITVVNGAPTGADTSSTDTAANAAGDVQSVGGIAPINGSVTFRVDGAVDESLVPVVYVDGGKNTRLEINDDGVPTEVFGLGGLINYNPTEADTGEDVGTTAVPVEVSEADIATNTFVAGGLSFTYDANDTFSVDGEQATFAQFEAALQAGDFAVVTDYQQDADLRSEFALTNTTEAAPVVDSVEVGETTVLFNVDDLADDASVTVYYAEDTTVGAGVRSFDEDDFTAVNFSTDGDRSEELFQATVTGLEASTEYAFYVTQTTDLGESDATAGQDETTTATPGDVKITSATVNEVNNGAGDSTTIRVVFSEDVTVEEATGFHVSPTNQSAVDFDSLTAVVGADGNTVTVTLDDALDDAATDVSYTVTVDAGAVAEVATGNAPNAELKATFSY